MGKKKEERKRLDWGASAVSSRALIWRFWYEGRTWPHPRPTIDDSQPDLHWQPNGNQLITTGKARKKREKKKGGKKEKRAQWGTPPRWAQELIFYIRTVKRNRNEIEAQKKIRFSAQTKKKKMQENGREWKITTEKKEKERKWKNMKANERKWKLWSRPRMCGFLGARVPFQNVHYSLWNQGRRRVAPLFPQARSKLSQNRNKGEPPREHPRATRERPGSDLRGQVFWRRETSIYRTEMKGRERERREPHRPLPPPPFPMRQATKILGARAAVDN